MLSGEETEELVRSVLSRPALGKLLIEMVCSDVVNSTWSTAPDAKEVLSTLISTVVCNMAKNVKTISQDLWAQVDKDRNGEVEAHEFQELFPVAFTNCIAVPLAADLARRGKQKLDMLKSMADAVTKP